MTDLYTLKGVETLKVSLIDAFLTDRLLNTANCAFRYVPLEYVTSARLFQSRVMDYRRLFRHSTIITQAFAQSGKYKNWQIL